MKKAEMKEIQDAIIRNYVEHAGATVQEYPEADARVVRWGGSSCHFFAMAFHGSCKKPDFENRFFTERQRELTISEYISDRAESLKRKQAARGKARELSGAALTAKVIRGELKKLFPSTKFSVRSSYFSMGNAVDVSWEDGPSAEMVDKIIKKYECMGFDGMTDSSYYIHIDEAALGCPGADYVQPSHYFTDEFKAAAADYCKSHDRGYLLEGEFSDRLDYINFYYDHMDEWASSDILALKAAQDKEDADAKAEQAKAEQERQAAEAAKCHQLHEFGADLIRIGSKDYPIKDGDNYILIHWSEHPAFSDYDDDSLKLSLKAADFVLGVLDKKLVEDEHRDRGYYKTKFSVCSPSSEVLYTDRYDIGDDIGGLFPLLGRCDEGRKLLPPEWRRFFPGDKPANKSNSTGSAPASPLIPDNSEKPQPGAPREIARSEIPALGYYSLRGVTPEALDFLQQIAAGVSLADPLPGELTRQIKKTPGYKKWYIRGVIQQAFSKKDKS